jgi:carboxylesterase type B
VNTHCGPVRGHYLEDVKTFEFLGIPFAKSTAGAKRWTAPEPLSKVDESCWNGTLDAFKFGSICPQPNPLGETVGDEDCLSVNIWTANLPNRSNTSLPVLVFIHGGSLVEGAASTLWHIPRNMARENRVISVSIQYRVGALGFLALESLSQRGGRNSSSPSGNYGFMDQILGIQWVQHNIKAFGGDSDNISVYGQSSGGTSVFVLLASPLFESKSPFTGETKPIFQRAISMSGSVVIDTPLHKAQQDNSIIISRTRCKDLKGEQQLECLYRLSPDEIVTASLGRRDLYPYWVNDSYTYSLPFQFEYQPGIAVIDDYVLQEPVLTALSRPFCKSNAVPVIVGTMAQEVGHSTTIDLHPVTKFTETEYHQFLLSWPGFTHDIADSLLRLYPMKDYKNRADWSLVTMISDIRVTCGNMYMSDVLATNRSRPVYYYNSPQHFSKTVWISPLRMQYAFHCLDMIYLFKIYDLLLTEITPDIVKCSDEFFDSFTFFAAHGHMDNSTFWKRFDQYSANIIQGIGSIVEPNFKREQCQYFHKIGWDDRWWTGQ